jgi:hypothetical protein
MQDMDRRTKRFIWFNLAIVGFFGLIGLAAGRPDDLFAGAVPLGMAGVIVAITLCAQWLAGRRTQPDQH